MGREMDTKHRCELIKRRFLIEVEKENKNISLEGDKNNVKKTNTNLYKVIRDYEELEHMLDMDKGEETV